MELFENTRLLRGSNTGTRVGNSDVEVPVYRFRRDTHLADVSELDRVADQVEEHLGEALLVAKPNRQGLCDVGRDRKLLVLRQRFGRGVPD